jgi:hypothetical protein
MILPPMPSSSPLNLPPPPALASMHSRSPLMSPPPTRVATASPIRLPHPSATVVAPPYQGARAFLLYPTSMAEAGRTADPECRLLIRSSSAALKRVVPPIQNLASSSAHRPHCRSRSRRCYLLPPHRTTFFLHVAFRNDTRPAGPRFQEHSAFRPYLRQQRQQPRIAAGHWRRRRQVKVLG